jgi:hypothetical protein
MHFMDPSRGSHRPSRRTFVFLGAAGVLALLAHVSGWGTDRGNGPSSNGSPVAESPSGSTHLPAPEPPLLRRPPSALAELGVLTDKSEAELTTFLSRVPLVSLLRPSLCGDAAACTAVANVLSNDHATTLRIVPGSEWNLEAIDVDASAGSLPPRERGRVHRARVVVVRIAVTPSPRQLAVRTAFAAAAVIAEKVDGLVYDRLLGRIETARDFAAHAVAEPLDQSAFRKDRVALLREPRDPGVVRLLTAGLSRWGAPDVEAAAVPDAAVDRMSDVVLGVAGALANGAATGPIPLTRDDLARARGAPYPGDAGVAGAAPIAVEVVPVHPEGGDPNDFLARIEAPGGDGPASYLDLTKRLFGP